MVGKGHLSQAAAALASSTKTNLAYPGAGILCSRPARAKGGRPSLDANGGCWLSTRPDGGWHMEKRKTRKRKRKRKGKEWVDTVKEKLFSFDFKSLI